MMLENKNFFSNVATAALLLTSLLMTLEILEPVLTQSLSELDLKILQSSCPENVEVHCCTQNLPLCNSRNLSRMVRIYHYTTPVLQYSHVSTLSSSAAPEGLNSTLPRFIVSQKNKVIVPRYFILSNGRIFTLATGCAISNTTNFLIYFLNFHLLGVLA